MDEQKDFYKADLLSVDPIKCAEGGWEWNQSFSLEKDIYFGKDCLTTRKILSALREWGYLSKYSKGRVQAEEFWPYVEIQTRSGKPLLCLVFED